MTGAIDTITGGDSTITTSPGYGWYAWPNGLLLFYHKFVRNGELVARLDARDVFSYSGRVTPF